ncbi:MAG: hypothetical protein ACKO3B_09670, partial [Bacteroidota bacterium]
QTGPASRLSPIFIPWLSFIFIHVSRHEQKSTHGTPLTRYHGSAINHLFKEHPVSRFPGNKATAQLATILFHSQNGSAKVGKQCKKARVTPEFYFLTPDDQQEKTFNCLK